MATSCHHRLWTISTGRKDVPGTAASGMRWSGIPSLSAIDAQPRAWRSSSWTTPAGSPSSRIRRSTPSPSTGSKIHTFPSSETACEQRLISAGSAAIHPNPHCCSSQKRTSISGSLGRRAEAPRHDLERLGVRVDEDVPPAELCGGSSERSASGKGVETPIAGPRRSGHDAPEDAERLLRRITGLLAAGRRDDRVPPDVRRQLPARRLFRRHEPRRHVRLAVDRSRVEEVTISILDVHEDGVVLRRPAPASSRAVVVCPDDLVQEAIAAEDLVEQHLAVVGLAEIEVEVERSAVGEQPVRLTQARLEERDVVVEAVRERARRELRRSVAPAVEPGPVAARIRNGGEGSTRLDCAGVERRIGVDQLEEAVAKPRQQR